MSYLICQRCFGYYELQENELPEDFESCECGGFLEIIDNIGEFINPGTVIRDDDLKTHYVCPNIYCNYKKSLKKGENCPKCGSTVVGSGFKESLAILGNINRIRQDNVNYDIKCPNPLCGYTGINNSLNCPECGISLEMEEKNNRPSALGLFSIKGSGEIQKGDYFYRRDD